MDKFKTNKDQERLIKIQELENEIEKIKKEGLTLTDKLESDIGAGTLSASEEQTRTEEIENLKKQVEIFQAELESLKNENTGESEKPGKGFAKFGISGEDLGKIKVMEGMNEAQKLIVLDNLEQLTAGRIEEEGLLRYQKEKKEAGFWGKIWKNMGKDYYLGKAKYKTAEELMAGGIETHGKIIEDIAKKIKDNNIDGVILENGKVSVNFLNENVFTNPTEEQKNLVQEFNELARELSSFSYEKTKKDKTDKIWDKEEEYDKKWADLRDMLGENIARSGDLGPGGAFEEAQRIMRRIDANVKINRFFEQYPDAEKEIENMSHPPSVWKGILQGFFTKNRFISTTIGGGIRATTAAAFGAYAAPVAGLAVGGILGWRRAEAGIKESDYLAKRGVKDENKTAKGVRDVIDEKNPKAGLAQKLKALNERIKNPSASEKLSRAELLRMLESRIRFTQQKLQREEVNFGKGVDRVRLQEELGESLSESSVIVYTCWLEMQEKESEDLRKISRGLGDFFEFQDKLIGKKRFKKKVSGAVSGAFMGAVAAEAGYQTMDYLKAHDLWPFPDFLKGHSATETTTETLPNDNTIAETIKDVQKSGIDITKISSGDMADDDPFKGLQESAIDTTKVVLPPDSSGIYREDSLINVPEATTPTPETVPSSATPAVPPIQEAPTVEQTIKTEEIILDKNAIVGKGEGIEHALQRQGLSGKEAHLLAIKAGYVDSNGNEVRVALPDKAAYIVHNDNGNLSVEEKFLNKDGAWESKEIHTTGEKFEGEKIEKEYEYLKHGKGTAEEIKPKTLTGEEFLKTKTEESYTITGEKPAAVEAGIAGKPGTITPEKPTTVLETSGTSTTISDKTNIPKEKIVDYGTGGRTIPGTSRKFYPYSYESMETGHPKPIGYDSYHRPIYPHRDQTEIESQIPKEIGDNPYHLSAEELKEVNKTYDANLAKIFQDESTWNKIKDSTGNYRAEAMMAKKEEGYTDEVNNLIKYLHKLQKVTGLKPREETSLKPGESMAEYIKRALQKAKADPEIGLDKVKL